MRFWLITGLFLLFVVGSFTPRFACASVNQDKGVEKSLADINPAELDGWTIRRLEFLGNVHVRDDAIHRYFVKGGVQEGGSFDPKKLKRVLAKINRSGLFEKITEKDVTCAFNKEYHEIDLLIVLHELPKDKSGRK